MHIGVDATCWQNNRGYGRHARALLCSLVRLPTEHSFTFFLDSDTMLDRIPQGVEVRMIPVSAPASQAASAKGRRSLPDMWRASRMLSSASVDILLYPTIYTYVPAVSHARKVVMIHDDIAETFPELTMPRRISRWFWDAKVALGRAQADAVVTVSDYSKQRLSARFGIDPGRLFVVGEAPDPAFRVLANPRLPTALTDRKVQSEQPLIVYVGGFSPHKNLDALIVAFESSLRNFPDARLILVGDYQNEVFHSYWPKIAQRAESLIASGRVLFPGYLSDEELCHLLNLARVSVLPSFLEGYGLPAVEAAACGCPVIATNASPLPQILGSAGQYFDPHSAELSPILQRVLGSESLRAQMRASGLEAVAQLSWDRAAREMLQVFGQLT